MCDEIGKLSDMKVLYITNGFPPQRWAGTETYTANIAKEIKNRGISVQVLCCGVWSKGQSYWNGYDDDAYNDIPVRRINLNWKKLSDPATYLYNNPVVRNYLDQYLDEHKPDIVHVTSCETLSASVLKIVKQKQIPLVLSITDFWFLCPRINLLRSNGKNCDGIKTPWECQKCLANHTKIYRWLRSVFPEKGVKLLLTVSSKLPLVARQRGFRGYVRDMSGRKKFLRSAFSLPDVRLTASEFVKNVHIKNRFDDPIKVHPYGHDLSWLGNIPEKKRHGETRLGFIGQIIPSKGVHLILDALKLLNERMENKIIFSIYGSLKKNPNYGARIQENINTMENVKFCGTYPHNDTEKVFSEIDILVVPSLWYDFPLIIYESFATKTPVIASNLGGMAEAVAHEVNGLLFERDNVVDLAKQIERLTLERHLLKKLSNGIPTVKTIEEEGSELVSIYQELIQEEN